MDHKEQNLYVRVDSYTRVCLTVIAVLLTVVIIGLWVDGVPSVEKASAAKAAMSNAIRQTRLLEAQKQANTKLDELITLLKSGQLKVEVTKMPKSPAGGTNGTQSIPK